MDGEQFLISNYGQSGDTHHYGYVWLTGPNHGYGYGSFGPAEKTPAEHKADIREFLSDIDPGTGYLSDPTT